MRKTKTQKGITLVALIITIVVLLVLATVAISSIKNDGIISKAQDVANKFNEAQANEQNMLEEYLNYLNPSNGGSTVAYEEVTLAVAISDVMLTRTENSQTKDIYGNTIKIPAGFKILVDSTTVYTGITDIAVEKGIVITDGTNEFVYVPVGEIKTATDTKTITLARYEFDITVDSSTGTIGGTGAITEEGTHTSAEAQVRDPLMSAIASMQNLGDVYFVEGEIEGIDDQNKGYALNISDFYSKASSGYYIGRYEARTNTTTARAEGDSLTAVTLNKANVVYNYVTQPDATNACQTMYTNKPFITDLINSYAWDTAIAFIQSFEDSEYSLKATVNTVFSNIGTVGTETEDKVCNIYDMASNCVELSTETCSLAGFPCTYRGGSYNAAYTYSSCRGFAAATHSSDYCSFRPILYL